MSTPVCLITTTHLASNPRLVKEAGALIDSGYQVSVLYYPHIERLYTDDDEVLESMPALDAISLTERALSFGARIRHTFHRAEFALWRRVVERIGMTAFDLYAMMPRYRAFYRRAVQTNAELYIAHNLGALPVAARAAASTGAKLGFDAEDFHRGEYADPSAPRAALTRRIEATFIPQCDYVTAASDGIAEAYVRVLDIPRPATVLNVFPLADRECPLSAQAREQEKPSGITSLYWFSQIVGPGRGLEDVVRALPHLDETVHLSLRGAWDDGYEEALGALAQSLGVRDRIRHLAVAPPGEMIARAACHDVGLALETGETENRQICVTNKIFTYLLAGLPSVATDTEGQRGVAQGAEEAVALYSSGDSQRLANAVRTLLGSERPRQVAERMSTSRYNWEVEREVFLAVVRDTLAGSPKRVTSASSSATEDIGR